MSAAELVEDWLCLGCWDTAREGGAFNYLPILRWAASRGDISRLQGEELKGTQLSSLLNPGCYFCTLLGLPVTTEDYQKPIHARVSLPITALPTSSL